MQKILFLFLRVLIEQSYYSQYCIVSIVPAIGQTIVKNSRYANLSEQGAYPPQQVFEQLLGQIGFIRSLSQLQEILYGPK